MSGVALACVAGGATLFVHRRARGPAAPPTLEISVRAWGSAAELERSVAHPLEAALRSVPRVADVTSTSREGGVRTVLTFEKSTDLDVAATSVLGAIPGPALPADALTTVIRPAPAALQLLVTSGGARRETQRLAEEISRRVQTVPGVRSTHLCGGGEAVVRVVVDLPRLAAHAVDARAVRSALDGTLAAGHARVPDAIRKTEVRPGVRVEDLAVIEEGFVADACRIQSEPTGGILLEIGVDGSPRSELLRRLDGAIAGVQGVSWLSFADGRERRMIVFNPAAWDCVTKALGGTGHPWAAVRGHAAGQGAPEVQGASAPPIVAGRWDDATILFYDEGLHREHAPRLSACEDLSTVLERPADVREVRVIGEASPDAARHVAEALRVAKLASFERRVRTTPATSVNVDRARAASLGITAAEVSDAVRMAASGVRLGSGTGHGGEPPVLLVTRPARIDEIGIVTAGRGVVPLGQVAAITVEPDSGPLRRTNGRRYRSLAVTGEVARIRAAVAGVKLPAEVVVEVR